MRPFIRTLAPMLLAACLPLAAQAQERPNTILVLDASGSMWGQIDEINKIVIARDVVGELLDTFPEDQNLGLTVYGHRTRGDCSDIQTLVEPGLGTVPAIRDAVNTINPRGMTPMADSVIAAAEALRFTEQKATVILVSDGIETCNPDPCAAARALEEAGIDFTAHVVGFDVTDPEALAQMQCIAEETGGLFTTASNAAELSTALGTVTAAAVAPAPEPEPEPAALVPVIFRAVEGSEDGPEITDPILWSLSGNDGPVFDDVQANPLEDSVETGAYTATAYRVVAETEASAQFVAIGEGPAMVTIVFPEILPTASLVAPASAPLGATIQVGWDGPGDDNDYISVAQVDAPGNRYENFTYTRAGNPLGLLMPSSVGTYEVRYIRHSDRSILASQQIEVTPIEVQVMGPETAIAGETVQVGFVGPAYDNDYITISQPDDTGYENFTYTRAGNPLGLLMPTVPGEYELRYVLHQDRVTMAVQPITVTDVSASLTAPDTAEAGSTVQVGWDGPNYDNDYITVSKPGDDGYENFTYTRAGNPLDLLMPTEPGDYELRYVVRQDRSVLATRTITVTDIGASLTAPDTAEAGSTVQVGWDGPNYDNDYITVSKPGDDGYENFTYTRAGNPLDLLMPTEPGDYELRYVVRQDRSVLATRLITVTKISGALTAPATAEAGSTVQVGWEGPDYDNDYITVSRLDDDGYETFTYTRAGNPLDLVMPPEPGEYEIRYVVRQDRSVLARQAITVTEIEATLVGPDTVTVGATIDVGWTGPDYDRDFISVGPQDGGRYMTYTYTSQGNPLRLTVPTEPGTYELRYQLGQGNGILTSVPITVEAAKVSLSAPAEAAAGSQIEVAWEGPGNDRDYIAIGTPGSNDYPSYAYTDAGNPATLTVPGTQGSYELRYHLADGTILQRVALTATLPEAVLIAPPVIPLSMGAVPVGWDGPGNQGDFLSIGQPGSDDYATWVSVDGGNPLNVSLPDSAGDWELRYHLAAGGTIIARVPLEITE